MIVVEGNIGAGKSTLMRTAETLYPDTFDCYYEPIKRWTEDTSLLADLYEDPKRNAFAFEVGSLLELSKELTLTTDRSFNNPGCTGTIDLCCLLRIQRLSTRAW